MSKNHTDTEINIRDHTDTERKQKMAKVPSLAAVDRVSLIGNALMRSTVSCTDVSDIFVVGKGLACCIQSIGYRKSITTEARSWTTPLAMQRCSAIHFSSVSVWAHLLRLVCVCKSRIHIELGVKTSFTAVISCSYSPCSSRAICAIIPTISSPLYWAYATAVSSSSPSSTVCPRSYFNGILVRCYCSF